MKEWHETDAIARGLREALGAGKPVALCTVVAIAGSSYRRPGAKLLVGPTIPLRGALSGGCLEADAREVALDALETGHARIRRYETGEDTVWGLGLGCDGTVEVFVQPVQPAQIPVWNRVAELLAEDDAFVLATAIAGPATGRSAVILGDQVTGATGVEQVDKQLVRLAQDTLADRRSRLVDVGESTAFFEVLQPPPRLVIVGAGDDAIPLARAAAAVGFRLTVVDHRPAYLAAERFPDAAHLVKAAPEDDAGSLALHRECYAVVMNHALARDRAWIRTLLGSPVPYVGVLGPRARVAKILDEVGRDASDRVFGPVGLDIGANGPEQIAVSVLAEVLAVRAGRPPQHLRERASAIHGG
jgi:xanthine/CO dehydrogenase XdhC/CoxF family maturation factor